MHKIIDALANLIDVRSIISLCAVGVFAVLSLKGVFEPTEVMSVILIVFSFYLGRTTGKAEGVNETLVNNQKKGSGQ